MRVVAVVLGFLLLVFAAAELAQDAGLTPAGLASYAASAHAVLSTATAGLALVLLLALLAWRPKTAPAIPAPSPAPPPVTPAVPAPTAKQAEAEVVSLLALLQEKGRLVDFLMDDIARYSDAEVGAAGRVLHEGCKAVLNEHFGIRPVREEGEGAKVSVPRGYAADEYRLVGRISGEPPFTGTLVHHGWRTEWVKLPRLVRKSDDRPPAIAPAEVELK